MVRVRIEKVPPQYEWMEAYQGIEVPVLKTSKTEKVTAVQVDTHEGPMWIAAHNLRRVQETENAA